MTLETSWWSDTSVIVHISDEKSNPTEIGKYLQNMLPETLVKIGLATVLVQKFYPDTTLQHETALVLAQYQPTEFTNREGKLVEIPLVYNGMDIEDVATQLDVPVQELIKQHQATLWEVAMIGFAPGFPYLRPVETGKREFWNKISRLDTPRSSTPAGSVAVAAGMSAIYPSSMPGGWSVIGQTPATLFNPNLSQPSLLHQGDRVRFVETVDS